MNPAAKLLLELVEREAQWMTDRAAELDRIVMGMRNGAAKDALRAEAARFRGRAGLIKFEADAAARAG